eukprot:CAMPEP_0182869958 /NCGR_PEP_ID=MMETSP0034_2-20130328/10241_1 /TAXON_ID=156128 /ORGANISM="Nephroselmis pyriformis, Strain CCMP717" /LENGTH=102 /DNA_ID=CAMNT_0025002441 /DNA_START=744 /DNA_END=1053 /DNA_ORIENTATION=+
MIMLPYELSTKSVCTPSMTAAVWVVATGNAPPSDAMALTMTLHPPEQPPLFDDAPRHFSLEWDDPVPVQEDSDRDSEEEGQGDGGGFVTTEDRSQPTLVTSA